MPHVAVNHYWLAVQHLCPDIEVVLRKLDRDQFSHHAGLATEGNDVVGTRVLNDHILQHPQHPLGRLQDGESDMAPTTGHSHLTDRVARRRLRRRPPREGWQGWCPATAFA